MSTEVGDQGIRYLTDLSQLRSLDLWHTNIGNEGAKHLNKLTSLRKLGLSSTQVTDQGLRHLGNLTSLRLLFVSEQRVSKQGLLAWMDQRSKKILEEDLQPCKPEKEQRIKQLIKDLGANAYRTRRRAQKSLIQLGAPALYDLKKNRNHPNPEVRMKIRMITRAITNQHLLVRKK